MGTGYTWTNRDSEYANAADSDFFVDGEKFVLPAQHWDSYILDTAAPTPIGTVQFDIFLPVLSNYTTQSWPEISLRIGGGTFDCVLNIGPGDPGDQELYIGDAGVGGTGIEVPVDPGNWYTAKMSYSRTTGVTHYKLWKTGTVEPGWMYTGDDDNANFSDTWLDILWTGSVESYLDNLVVEPAIWTGFTADAVISGSPFINANAVIWATMPGSFTADAVIGVVTSLLTADAYIFDEGMLRHHYFHDHDGTLTDLQVVLDEPINEFSAGTTLREVLNAIVQRAAGGS